MKLWRVNILRIFVILISIIMLSLFIFVLPNIADHFEKVSPELAHMKLPLLIGIYFTGIPFYIAVFNVFKLLRLIERDVVFSMDSLYYLNTISKCSISEIILYLGGIIYLYINGTRWFGITLLGALIMFISFIIYIFIEILKELLLKSVEMKTENELTI